MPSKLVKKNSIVFIISKREEEQSVENCHTWNKGIRRLIKKWVTKGTQGISQVPETNTEWPWG